MQQLSLDTELKPTREVIRATSLADVFQGLPMALLLSVFLAAVTVVVLSAEIPIASLIVWGAALLCVSAARWNVYRRYSRAAAAGEANLNRFERPFLVGTLTSGAVWGALSVVMFPRDTSLQLFLAFVMSGMAAGAATTLSAQPRAAFGYVLLSVLPLGIQLALLGTTLGIAMSLMVGAFLAGVGSSINRLHERIVALVAARVEADVHLRQLEQAQTELQAVNERLRIATAVAKLGVWEWDLQAERLVWDARMYEMYAVDPAVVPSYELHRQLVHPQDVARLEGRLQELRAGGDLFEEQFRIVRPDGTERTLRGAARVQRSPDGRLARMVGVNWDVTEINRLDRLKVEFVSIVSHELRTPLTSIRGSLGLIVGGAAGQLPQKAQELVQMADRNAARLAALIDDLLDMEKIASGRIVVDARSQPLTPLLEQALDANAGYAHAHQMSFQLSGQCDALVNVDALRFLQVMANLLSNAAKFSPAGSVVTVAAERITGGVRIAIRDRGPGIPKEFEQRIFSKFAQGDSSDARAKGGTGLGLAISKALIEQMRGTIGYDTHPEGGAVFSVVLPEVAARQR